MERSSGAIRTACDLQIVGRRWAGRPKLREKDCSEWKLMTVDAQERCEILLCMQLASYLEGGPLMWMMPLHLHLNQN